MDDRRIARRSFLQGAGLAALTAAGIVPCESQVQIAVPNSGGTEPPKLKAPAFASDCHHHIYDTARFPAVPRPEPNASVVEYRLYKRRIGTTRDVIVTPGAYGITVSHSTLFHPTVTDTELASLARGGIRHPLLPERQRKRQQSHNDARYDRAAVETCERPGLARANQYVR